MAIEIAGLDEDGNVQFDPEAIMRSYERRFFPEIAPVEHLLVYENEQQAAYYLPSDNVICISSFMLKYGKMLRIMILHELIHSKLFKENGDPDPDEGERFHAEAQKLWDAGVYRKLL
jgi:hypothetical protein